MCTLAEDKKCPVSSRIRSADGSAGKYQIERWTEQCQNVGDKLTAAQYHNKRYGTII